jgi:hypothetical protein
MANTGTDQGYTIHGPTTIDRTLSLKNGLTLETNRQSGVVVSETPGSLLLHATLFAQGTTVRDAAGAIVCDARLYEFTGPDGDSAWAIGANWMDAEAATFRLVQGTGKWEGLGGTFKALGVMRERADDHNMLRWEACWEVDPDRTWDYEALLAAGD